MSKHYVKTVYAGRYVKSVRYPRILRSDSPQVRSAKTSTTNKAQRYTNLKNGAEKLQFLLCTNFDEKDACFCTFTFSEENLPVNRKQARQIIRSFLSALRRKWRKQQRQLKYIYTIEGSSLSVDPQACPIDGVVWEIRPWDCKKRWEALGNNVPKRKTAPVRFHIHCILLLNREDRKTVENMWPYGFAYINPMKVDDPITFQSLAFYITKESRSGSLSPGSRSYVPSRDLDQPEVKTHWCDAHEVFDTPPGATVYDFGRDDTQYTSYYRCFYRLPRPKKQPKTYRSKGRLN